MLVNNSWPGALPRAANQKLPQVRSLSPWFEIREVSADTFALLEPHHCEEVISYLIIGTRQAVLFDTGMGIADIGAEVRRLTKRRVIAVNSHSHYDHVAGNYLFEEVWAFDDDFEIARIERGLSPEECRQEFMFPGSYLNLPPSFDLERYSVRPSRVSRRLRDGETLDLGNRTLTVLHTPAETPGAICLLEDRDGLLFTGDIICPGGTLWAHLPESDFGSYRRSLEYLVGLLPQVSLVCPAHNQACASTQLLKDAHEAFERVAEGRVAPAEEEGDVEIYRFEGFRLALPRGTAGQPPSVGLTDSS